MAMESFRCVLTLVYGDKGLGRAGGAELADAVASAVVLSTFTEGAEGGVGGLRSGYCT
jgi:hypothetical protein